MEQLLYYYGFEYDKSFWFLANDDGRTIWKNWTTATEEDLQHFFIFSDEDLETLDEMIPFEMDSFPFNVQKYLVSDIDPEFYNTDESCCGGCETPCEDKH